MDKVISKAKELLRELEGLYLKPYKCPVGRWMIGYGDNLEVNGLTVDEVKLFNFDKTIPIEFITRWQKVGIGTKEIKPVLDQYHKAISISKATADVLLNNEVARWVQQLTKCDYFTTAPENVQIALICICFQCGFKGMSTNIYVDTKPFPWANTGQREKKYFINCIIEKDYIRAGGILRAAPIFNSTRRRAALMADMISGN